LTLVAVPNPFPSAGHFNRALLGIFSQAPRAATRRRIRSSKKGDREWNRRWISLWCTNTSTKQNYVNLFYLFPGVLAGRGLDAYGRADALHTGADARHPLVGGEISRNHYDPRSYAITPMLDTWQRRLDATIRRQRKHHAPSTFQQLRGRIKPVGTTVI
jgi:hypothetical protein